MKINWKVRLANPVFWVQMLCALFLPILTYFGLRWEDMTTWAAIIAVVFDAVCNPVVVVMVVSSVWAAVNDPTTPGAGDSKRALSYIRPGRIRETPAVDETDETRSEEEAAHV